MKTFITIIFSVLFLSLNAQENRYEQAISGAIEKLNQITNTEDYVDIANTFERIGLNEKEEWLPRYYAAFSYIVMAYSQSDLTKTDNYLDKAQKFLDEALKLNPQESELQALQAFLYPARITVDPMGRGAEFMGKMNTALDLAIKLNPENPRSYYLRAITTLNMPEAFGGGGAAAKPIFELAKTKFDKFQPASSISPNWGKEQNEEELSKL